MNCIEGMERLDDPVVRFDSGMKAGRGSWHDNGTLVASIDENESITTQFITSVL